MYNNGQIQAKNILSINTDDKKKKKNQQQTYHNANIWEIKIHHVELYRTLGL